MTDKTKRAPIVIDLDTSASQTTPADVAPVPEPVGVPAMERATHFSAQETSPLLRWFLGVIGALIGFMVSVALWDFAANMLARNVWLGRGALALLAVALGLLLVMGLRELAALSRLRKIDGLRQQAERLQTDPALDQTHALAAQLTTLYKGRADLRWGLAELAEHQDEILDGEALLAHMENSLMVPLDKQAREQIESAARQVAMATALVPLAFADVIVALIANIRMIGRIAGIYGGRSGSLGSWWLIRGVAAHLVATGAVAVGDDLIGSVAGGGVLSKISRRFGEGMINGALTARVGIAAMEVCRPMPFNAAPKPKVTGIVSRALTGLF